MHIQIAEYKKKTTNNSDLHDSYFVASCIIITFVHQSPLQAIPPRSGVKNSERPSVKSPCVEVTVKKITLHLGVALSLLKCSAQRYRCHRKV